MAERSGPLGVVAKIGVKHRAVMRLDGPRFGHGYVAKQLLGRCLRRMPELDL